MDKILKTLTLLGAMALLPGLASAQPATLPKSLVLEAQAAIGRGVQFLITAQAEDGSWLNEPAITALAVMALHQSGMTTAEVTSAVAKARQFMLRHAQPDGSIAGSQSKYVNYSTATCLAALATLNNPADKQQMRKSRNFLIGMQLDEDHPEHPTQADNAFYGGIGYGSGGPARPDLSNTQWALEALYLTEHLVTEAEGGSAPEMQQSELAWQKALQFLSNVQNIPKDAGPTWVVNLAADSEQDGGFIYHPEESKAAQAGTETLRSYGSMTYAGLKSMLYAKLDKDDPRVKAAVAWASRHYTTAENPQMGPEGHYYYLLTFAKAHAALGADVITTQEGAQHNWRADLIRKLLELQKPDGQWFNDKHGRWMESLPQLVTAYSLISLEAALGDQVQAP